MSAVKNKKKVDERVISLIRNGVDSKQRSFFIIVGDRSRDRLPVLHNIMMNADLKMNKSVLWAYKKKLLGFTSHRKKREDKFKKDVKRGKREANDLDPFETFISNQNIRYVYYKETEKILGNTYGMCILQDFEGLTPNLMARTIETVEGGGLVVILLKSMTSLKQLYTMTMDIHSRYRTEAHNDVVARFNERFLLSLKDCGNCLVIDDEMHVLPVTGREIKRLPPKDDDEELTPNQQELAKLKEDLSDTQPAGALVNLTKTLNQGEAVLRFIDSIAEKTLNTTVTLTAGRGRGKSAALGIAIAAAVAQDYSNIFVTSPSPENLKTLFEFIFKGFDAMGYVEHQDYDIIQSTNPSFGKAIVRVDIKRGSHRQTIQYISPTDHQVLGQAELLIIDEAAAIPLPVVKRLLGPYLIFMASTINGYEGTGRSLSLKLIQQLRDQSNAVQQNSQTQLVSRDNKKNDDELNIRVRNLVEVTLDEPIRYAPGDKVEGWLNKLLCLDATSATGSKFKVKSVPHPNDCNLYLINRDSLFSYHEASELFLQSIMALFVSSHYKNSPNDLQLMSDAPAHQLYVLFGPEEEAKSKSNKNATVSLPTPLCVIQLALEGEISKESVRSSLSRGIRAGGDLIPWLVAQQFQDDEFASLSGARIVRIATNPEYTGMGYGLRALNLLTEYFEGKFTNVSEATSFDEEKYNLKRISDDDFENQSSGGSLVKEEIKPLEGSELLPLFINLSERPPYFLHYLGVSYGLTNQLLKFWKKSGYVPVYLRQTSNDLTGEHTCVMLKTLENRQDSWLSAFSNDFHKRFINLLSYNFDKFPAVQALTILDTSKTPEQNKQLAKGELDDYLTPFDLKRLESYANNLIDYHVIVDMLPYISQLYFQHKIAEGVKLSHVQSAILLAIGLQHKDMDTIAKELKIESNQAMAMFAKIVRKVATYFKDVLKQAISDSMPALEDDANIKEMNGELSNELGIDEIEQELEDELEEGGKEALSAMREKQKELINSLNLERYAINEHGSEWENNKKQLEKAVKKNGVVALKSDKKKRKTDSAETIYQEEMKTVQKKLKKPKNKK